MTKPNKDGWIRHRGGRCPVEAGTLIDVRHRDGLRLIGVKAERDWDHVDHPGDIMSYRLHKPEQPAEPAPVELPERYGQIITATIESVSGPLEWRDRIREIDATVEALEEERVSLVQKLEDEGFKLIASINALIDEAKEAHEEMSDWRNWKSGDKLSVVNRIEDSHNFEFGLVVTMVEHDTNKRKPAPYCTGGDGEGWWVFVENLEFHSRPTA